MNKINNKIFINLKELAVYCQEIKNQNKKISFCQGHFNVIHPGHRRFLEFTKKQGDILVVAVLGKDKLEKRVQDKFFSCQERSQGVASLEFVNAVFVLENIKTEEILDALRPDFFVMGEEFSQKLDLVKDQIELVKSFGGKVLFNSGDPKYTTTDFLTKDLDDLERERRQEFAKAIEKQHISISQLLKNTEAFSKSHVLVIGDTIVDQYVACDPIGMSSEAPVLVVKEIEQKEFVGGAAVVSRHVKALGAKCSFISVLGNDGPADLVKSTLQNESINTFFVTDDSRPTTFKIRYMVASQKLFRVSRLKETHINAEMENKIIEYINEILPTLDGIIISDFGYGVITQNILNFLRELAQKHSLKIFGDVQSSSQVGNVSKMEDFHLLTPTEKEARLALNDKYSGLEVIGNTLLKQTRSSNILLTLGPQGFVAFEKTNDDYFTKTQHFPALNPYALDVVGAGDSLLSAMAVSISANFDLMSASTIGATVAGLAVGKIGNIPIRLEEVKTYLSKLEKEIMQ